LPVPPPVMTATTPSTRKRDAASRLDVIASCDITILGWSTVVCRRVAA
jgi:hypothetical protein